MAQGYLVQQSGIYAPGASAPNRIPFDGSKLDCLNSLDLVAIALVLGGALIMMAAILPVRRLMAQLVRSPLRQRWNVMAGLIGLFLVGYAGYTVAFWNRHEQLLDLIVPAVFLGGACFVWLTATLSLQTAIDMQRVSRLEQEVVTDSLTGVFNRRYLDNRLAEELGRSRRYGFALSAIFLDIDHFKHVNDTHGHPVGDVVLAGVAEIISGGLRDTDVAARYGGEEFIVLTPHTAQQGATDLAQRLIDAIQAHTFLLPDAPASLRITGSAGVSTFGGGDTEAKALLDTADRNLYQAKRQGRNRVVNG